MLVIVKTKPKIQALQQQISTHMCDQLACSKCCVQNGPEHICLQNDLEIMPADTGIAIITAPPSHFYNNASCPIFGATISGKVVQ